MNIAIVKLASLWDSADALPVAATLRAQLPDARVSSIVARCEAAPDGRGLLLATLYAYYAMSPCVR